jgi:hypothetical protein
MAESLEKLSLAEDTGCVAVPDTFLAPGEGRTAAVATATDIESFLERCTASQRDPGTGTDVAPVAVPAALAMLSRMSSPETIPSILSLRKQRGAGAGGEEHVFTVSSRSLRQCAEAHGVVQAVIPTLRDGAWEPSQPVDVHVAVSAIGRSDESAVVLVTAYAITGSDTGVATSHEVAVADAVSSAINNFLSVLDCRESEAVRA